MAIVLRGDPTDEGMAPTPYEAWVRRQGVPVIEGYGITDLREPATAYWDRLGCLACFVILRAQTRNEAKTLVTSTRQGGTMIPYED